MASLVYLSKEGDTAAYICWKVYGKTEGVVEQLLNANHGLAALGPILPIGTEVKLPEVTPPERVGDVGLWG